MRDVRSRWWRICSLWVVLALVSTPLAQAAATAPSFGSGSQAPAAPSAGVPMVALTTDNQLLIFDSASPETIVDTRTISGLQAGESVVGIDFRPATGGLYALGNTSRLYTIEMSGMGADAPATIVGSVFTTTLDGTEFGFDFNPTVDRIRIVSDADQNLRVNPNNGSLMVDGTLAYAMGDPNAGSNPNVTSAAYISNSLGMTTTTLYDIDTTLDVLVRQAPPNPGTLTTIGALGVDAAVVNGFDVTANNAAFAALNVADTSSLYSINLVTGAASLIGAIGDGADVRGLAAMPTNTTDADVYAVTTSNQLVSFNRTSPDAVNTVGAVTGLQSGESVMGIDFRPATGDLYALGSSSRLYTIDPTSGAATQVGAVFTTTLVGSEFGFDFNPTVDRIRVVSDARQNLRVNPDNGSLIVDGTLTYATTDTNAALTPNVVGAAYLNSFAGATATTLYDIDSGADLLLRQNPANAGTLFTVGPLGVDSSEVLGFDIMAGSNMAYAALQTEGSTSSGFYSVNLTNGTTTLIGAIGTTEAVRAIAIRTDDPDMYGLTTDNRLLGLHSAAPSQVLSSRAITGLQDEEVVMGIDFRPATGDLYALGSTSRLYTLDPTTASATQVGDVFTTTLNGTEFGFDFNPVVDRIRIVSDADQNLRVNPDNASLIVDGTLTYAVTDTNAMSDPNVTGAAYINNSTGVTMTTLYDIDTGLDVLARQSPANAGTLFTVGPLGVDTSNLVGFDVDDDANTAYAALTLETGPAPAGVSASSGMYSVNLSSGTATFLGTIGGGAAIRDIAFAVTPDNPTAIAIPLVFVDSGASGATGLVAFAVAGLALGLAFYRRRTQQ